LALRFAGTIKTMNQTPPNDLSNLLAELDDMGTEQLRRLWRTRLGEPPAVRSPDILRRSLAQQLQEQAFGTDRALERQLSQMAARVRPGHRPASPSATYRRGSVLTKVWQGEHHRVEVLEAGFLWNGEHHASLSSIARKITGVRWNGPRFFGLREEKG